MLHWLIQFVFLLGFYIHQSSGNDELLCYSCKGIECEQITNDDNRKIICNGKTELCWAGFVDQQPYRTCASRYCTLTDLSLDSDIHIETCCRSNLCNSAPLSLTRQGKLYSQISSSDHTETTTVGYFIDQIINKNSYDIEKPDKSESIIWDRLLYDKGFSTRLVSISTILLFLMPLLLVLLL